MDREIISSAHNATIKHLRKLLGSAKYRRENNLSVAEGIHLLASLLSTNIRLRQVVCAESVLQNRELTDLLERLDRETVSILVIKDSLFESLSQLHASVGVMSVIELPGVAVGKVIAASALLLEDVQDPGNLGTILRTAAAAGIGQVYLSAGSSSAWSPKALRAGMGAQFDLEIHEGADLLLLSKNSVVPVLATTLEQATSLYDTELAGDIAWVFGNEGRGVSHALLEACTKHVSIPQADGAVESLNVAAAVAVCLFEQRRQVNSQSVDY